MYDFWIPETWGQIIGLAVLLAIAKIILHFG